jgi:hypothetical protein
MKEEFLHFIWKYGLYDKSALQDADGNQITVLHPGEYNRDSGPDFFNAKIISGGILWAGNIEIHTHSSHFNLHGHHEDPMFDNVILHVVAFNDRKVFNSKGKELLTAELTFDDSIHDKYLSLINNPCIIACHDEISAYDPVLLNNWFDSLVIERLENKSDQILSLLSVTGNDWEETFYNLLSRYFGFRVNTDPFEMLARALPVKIIRKHSDSRFQIEALLFGTAGMLQEGLFREAIHDQYYKDLIKEYRILSAKYSLQPLHGWIWKFARLRPANFPTIRISQLAGMLSDRGGLFSLILEAGNIEQLRNLFEINASEYWDDHYIFGSVREGKAKKTGKQSADIIIINAVVPAIYVYGKQRGMPEYSERAVSFLEQIEPEDNAVIRDWADTGVMADNALSTQALLQLRDNYCRNRKCLDCRVGYSLIGAGKKLKDNSQLILEP